MGRRLISTGSRFEAELGYSRAVVTGDWCFVAGVTGYDYDTMTLPDGIASQAEACFRTIGRVLDDVGFAFSDIVRVTHYVTDRALVEELAPVLKTHLGTVRPAATLLVVDLLEAGILYEVEVTALRGS